MIATDVSNPASAITGIGLLCALGVGWDEWLPALMEAEPAFDTLKPDPGTPCQHATRLAGLIPDFDLTPLIRTPKTYLDPHSRITLAAVGLALQSARLEPEAVAGAGLLFGTAFGNLTTAATFLADAFQKSPRLVKPMLFPHAYANTSASLAAMEWALSGNHQCLTSGTTASGQALLTALDLHREGCETLLLVGGADALHAGFNDLSQAAASTPLPFNPASPGPVPGEAAVVLALQPTRALTPEHPAPAAWLLGGALGSAIGAQTSARYTASIVRQALADARLSIEQLHFACASADGDPVRDHLLVDGLARCLGNRPDPLPLLTPACLCGQVAGATDALLVAAACAAFETGRIPAIQPQASAAELPKGLFLPSQTHRIPDTGLPRHALTLTLDPAGALCCLVLQG